MTDQDYATVERVFVNHDAVVDHICPTCGVRFQAGRRYQYCSPTCRPGHRVVGRDDAGNRVIVRRYRVEDRQCRRCGTTFTGTRQQQYCNTRCRSSEMTARYNARIKAEKAAAGVR